MTQASTPDARAAGRGSQDPGQPSARPRVAVIFGGTSREHGVSCLTAASVLRVIDRSRYDVVGIGITLLNTVGRFFVGFVQRNPAYALVGGAVGVLVYLYVFNQLLLFGAAWAATSPHGRVTDLSADDKKAPVGQNAWIGEGRPR